MTSISSRTNLLGVKKLLLPALVISSVVAIKIISDNYINPSVPNLLQDFITLGLSLFIEAFPFLVLGSLLAAIINTYVPTKLFLKILPKNRVLKRFTMSLLGFLFPVCECGNVPLSRALIMQNFKPSEALTFLLAAPVINPVTIWATWTAFGYDSSIVFARVIATLIIANLIGFILSLVKDENVFLTKKFKAECDANISANSDSKSSKKQKLVKLSKSFSHEAFLMAKMLAFGAFIAASIQVLIPREILFNIGSNVIISIVVMLILAFIVSICANVDSFFALSFAGTFTAGSIVSFLVFGPMVDIKILALLKTTFVNKLLVTISILALLMSFITGLVVTYAF